MSNEDGNGKARIIRFDLFEVDRKAGELRRDGQLIRLQEQPFQVLSLLLERDGDVVTREELRRQVWAGQAFVDFGHGVNKAINKIRRALADCPQSPRYIATVGRRGYRFIGSIRTAEAGPPPRKLRLAVIPLDSLSDDGCLEYFSDGMTEELIAQIGRLDPQRLGVIARTSVLQYKNANKDIAQIGRELGVEYILEGSVRGSMQRVRITAQLIEVSDQTHLWTESYERELGDILSLQRDVAVWVGAELARRLMPQPVRSQPAEEPRGESAEIRPDPLADLCEFEPGTS